MCSWIFSIKSLIPKVNAGDVILAIHANGAFEVLLISIRFGTQNVQSPTVTIVI
jgi:hypothetical protein